MIKKLVCCVIFVVCVVGIAGQIPGMDFMQQIANNLNRIQTMNNAMMREGMSRAQAGRRYGPGATRFRTPDGGVGYVYNSPDGSSSSYSFSSGGPSHGFTYSFGPGGTYRREW
ncbi:uncharacterized protein LOC132737436 isoform X2 [Ruditapes philippinarum]|nr:uncharacterized protein LOC132737436 isoform X2 [Ruditapes philippinarum]